MKTFRAELQEVNVVEGVICNKCGKSCKDETTGLLEYVELAVAWGYGSSKDGTSHESHLCETCYGELIKTFVIPPFVITVYYQ